MIEVDYKVNEGDRVTLRWRHNGLWCPSYWEGTDEALGGMLVLACPF
jgi:hypothetical protein